MVHWGGFVPIAGMGGSDTLRGAAFGRWHGPGKAVLQDELRQRIRTELSPRFVPDEIVQVAEIPRTLTGKKMELPVRKLLLGQPVEKIASPDAMANPGSLAFYVALARELNAG